MRPEDIERLTVGGLLNLVEESVVLRTTLSSTWTGACATPTRRSRRRSSGAPGQC